MLRVWGDPTVLEYFCSPPPQTASRIWLLGQLIGCRILRRDYFESPVPALFRVTHYE